MVHQVAADLAARVREAFREARRRGVQQDAGRLDRGRAEEDDAAPYLDGLHRLGVEQVDAADPVLVRVVDQVADDAVRAQGQPAGRLGGGEGRVQAGEVGAAGAAAPADAAVVAGASAEVVLGQHRDPGRREAARAAEGPVEILPDSLLHAGLGDRRHELAVRELRHVLGLARDADEGLHVVVPGGEVPIADRPVRAVAVPSVGAEVQVAPAVALPSPQERPPADDAGANPQELLGSFADRVGVLDVVDEELAGPLVARGGAALDGLAFRLVLAVPEPPVGHLPGRRVLAVVALGDDGRTGLQHQRLQTLLGQLLRRPAAGDAGADDDRVPRLPFDDLDHCFVSSPILRRPRCRRRGPSVRARCGGRVPTSCPLRRCSSRTG